MRKFFMLCVVAMVLNGCATTGQKTLSNWQMDCQDRVERWGRHGLEDTGGINGSGGYDIVAYCAEGETILSLETTDGFQFVQLPNQWLHGEHQTDTRFYYDAGRRLVVTVKNGSFQKEAYDMATRQWRPFEQAGAQATLDELTSFVLIGHLRQRVRDHS